MAYSETTTTSYGQRLSGSLKGIVAGFLMFIVGTSLLWWNEGRAVKTTKAINEAQSVAVHIDDVSTVDASLNGKLIHASTLADTKDTLSDPMFGVHELAIKLNRKVEYYQWVESSKTETHDKIGGGQETITTYSYEQKWTSEPVNSGDFHDPQYRNSNTVLTNIKNQNQLAGNVTFGGYTLPEFIKNSISGNVPATVEMSEEQKNEWNRVLSSSRSGFNSYNSNALVNVNNNIVYFGTSSNAPHNGDVKVTFTKVIPSDISLIAKVNGSTFEDYKAKNGKSFSRVEMGTISADNMFQNAHDDNNMWTWILRLAGVFLVIFGLKSMFSILPTLFKVLPFLGNIVDAGVGLVTGVIGFVWSLIVIAIAWLFYRPILGIILLVIAIGGIIFLKKKAKERRVAQQLESTSAVSASSVQSTIPPVSGENI